MTQYNASILLPQLSGIIEALQNDLTLRASTSGDVLVGQDNNLRPEVDLQQDLGLNYLRWANLYAGNIETTSLVVNGIAASGNPLQQHIIYVGKHGNDSNTGKNVEDAVLTFGKAISLASGLVGTNKAAVVCFDAGNYAEGVLDIPNGVLVCAKSASYSGTIDLRTGSELAIHRVIVTPGALVGGIRKTDTGQASSGIARAQFDILDLPDADSYGIIVQGITQQNFGSELEVKGGEINVENDTSVGVFVSQTSLKLQLDKITVQGAFSVGVTTADNSTPCDIRGSVGHISGIGAVTGVNLVGGEVNLNVIDLSCPNGTAYKTEGSSSHLNMYANAIAGAEVAPDGFDRRARVVVAARVVDHIAEPSIHQPPVDAREVSGQIIPDTDCVYDLGSGSQRFNTVYACSGSFEDRPSVTGLDGAISGIGYMQENFFEEEFNIVNGNSGLAITSLNTHGVDSSVFPTVASRTVKLDPLFSYTTAHFAGPAPSEWVLRFIKNGTAVASGLIRWSAAGGTIITGRGQWIGGDPNVILTTHEGSETADSYLMILDNDGSGTLVNTIFFRGKIGFRVWENE